MRSTWKSSGFPYLFFCLILQEMLPYNPSCAFVSQLFVLYMQLRQFYFYQSFSSISQTKNILGLLLYFKILCNLKNLIQYSAK